MERRCKALCSGRSRAHAKKRRLYGDRDTALGRRLRERPSDGGPPSPRQNVVRGPGSLDERLESPPARALTGAGRCARRRGPEDVRESFEGGGGAHAWDVHVRAPGRVRGLGGARGSSGSQPPPGARPGSRGRGGRRRGAGPGGRGRAGRAQVRRRAAEDLVPRQNIGIQLYSLRDMQAASVPNTIDLLGDIGYPEVELFTLQGQTAATWRGILEDNNIRAIGAHVAHRPLAQRARHGPRRGRDAGHAVRRRPRDLRFRPSRRPWQGYRALAREMNRYGERVADRGMRFYYHNHNFEFGRAGGTRFYDVLLNETDPDTVFFELDIYWTVTAGVDPLDLPRDVRPVALAAVPRQGPRRGRGLRGPGRGQHQLRAHLPRAAEQALPPLHRRARLAGQPAADGGRGLRVPARPRGPPSPPAVQP